MGILLCCAHIIELTLSPFIQLKTSYSTIRCSTIMSVTSIPTLASRRDSAPTPHRLFCRCVENVRFLFSSLPERHVFFIINRLFQDCPSLFLPGWPPNNPNKRKFFILFRFCTKSSCTNDRQILQLFFIMKVAELFYE